jgi:hypothetical protein
MKLVPLNIVFDIQYGNQFDLEKMTLAENKEEGINFVSRSTKNYGIVARVQNLNFTEPYSAGLITVTLGGTYLLASFIQPGEFYTAQNIKILIPKEEMSFVEKLFYCLCIQKNRYRYSSHGREANISLDEILVPNKLPEKFQKYTLDAIIKNISAPATNDSSKLSAVEWRYYSLSDLFDIKKGERVLNRDLKKGTTPCIRAGESNNGIFAYVSLEPNHPGNTITVSYNGNIGQAFYQESPHFSLDDINVLHPKFTLNKYIALYFCTLIRKEGYRFNYGRKWNLARMNPTKIKLPSINGRPDYEFIEAYIKSLPYSGSI